MLAMLPAHLTRKTSGENRPWLQAGERGKRAGQASRASEQGNRLGHVCGTSRQVWGCIGLLAYSAHSKGSILEVKSFNTNAGESS